LDGQKPGLHLKLSDFGLAKDIEVDVELTQSQVALGTPLYMAPEQFMGQAEPRSDQYSLGVIVYQLLAGQPPFKGTTQYIMMQHLTEPPPPLESILPSIPGGLAQVVMRTLAKIPEERYASVLEMAAAFRQALQDWNTTEDERTQVLELEEPTQILLPPTLPFKPPQE
jgi:serine/threonine-protein kinase